jgi:aquaporin Z
MPSSKRLAAEFIGTLWLVLGGCGSAVLAAAFPNVGIGLHGVSVAFGLTVLTMAYAVGHISGCHLNPAVSFGLWAGKRFPTSDLVPYIIAQVLGAIAGAFVIYLIATGKPGFDVVQSGFAANGYGAHSPGGYSLFAAFVCVIVMTYMFLIVILGFHPRASACGVCWSRHRSCVDAHPFDQHPRDQYLGESGQKYRSSNLCRRLGSPPTLAFLGCANHRCHPRRMDLPLAW